VIRTSEGMGAAGVAGFPSPAATRRPLPEGARWVGWREWGMGAMVERVAFAPSGRRWPEGPDEGEARGAGLVIRTLGG